MTDFLIAAKVYVLVFLQVVEYTNKNSSLIGDIHISGLTE